jgi:hypothetical protein
MDNNKEEVKSFREKNKPNLLLSPETIITPSHITSNVNVFTKIDSVRNNKKNNLFKK